MQLISQHPSLPSPLILSCRPLFSFSIFPIFVFFLALLHSLSASQLPLLLELFSAQALFQCSHPRISRVKILGYCSIPVSFFCLSSPFVSDSSVSVRLPRFCPSPRFQSESFCPIPVSKPQFLASVRSHAGPDRRHGIGQETLSQAPTLLVSRRRVPRGGEHLRHRQHEAAQGPDRPAHHDRQLLLRRHHHLHRRVCRPSPVTDRPATASPQASSRRSGPSSVPNPCPQ